MNFKQLRETVYRKNQLQMDKLFGFNHGTIAGLEEGTIVPNFDHVAAFEKFGLDMAYLRNDAFKKAPAKKKQGNAMVAV